MDVIKHSRHGCTPDFHPHHAAYYSVHLLHSRWVFHCYQRCGDVYMAIITPPISWKVTRKVFMLLRFPNYLKQLWGIFYFIVHRKILNIYPLPFIVNIQVLLKKRYFTLSSMLCVWLQGEKLAKAADLVLPGNSVGLHALVTNCPWTGVH